MTDHEKPAGKHLLATPSAISTPTAAELDAAAPAVDENQIVAERRAKLARLRESGIAYPNDFVPADRAGPLLAAHAEHSREALEAAAVKVSVAGRMMLKRVQGKASFATIQDATDRLQLWINDEGVGSAAHDNFKHWDLGDIIAAEGTLFRTMKGELSVRVSSLRLLAKSLRPLPDKFHGLADQEQRYRQRHVDLIANEAARKTFIARSSASTACVPPPSAMTMSSWSPPATPPGGWTITAWQIAWPSGYSGRWTRSGPSCSRCASVVRAPCRSKPSSRRPRRCAPTRSRRTAGL